jgi:hypothetical protein
VKAVQTRLLDNQAEIGREFGNLPKVGKKNGSAIGNLLKEHILAADGVLQAALNNKPQAEKVNAFFQQGNDMSAKMASALKLNSEDATHLKNEFHAHNQHVIDLVTILLQKKPNFQSHFVSVLDEYQNHMSHLCDLLVWFTANH